jgi:hypothetical protein
LVFLFVLILIYSDPKLFLKDASEDQVKDLSLPTEGSVDLNLAGKWGQIIES